MKSWVVGEVERRLDQSDLHLIKEVEQLLLSAANGERYSVSNNVVKYHEDDIISKFTSLWFQILSRQHLKIRN